MRLAFLSPDVHTIPLKASAMSDNESSKHRPFPVVLTTLCLLLILGGLAAFALAAQAKVAGITSLPNGTPVNFEVQGLGYGMSNGKEFTRLEAHGSRLEFTPAGVFLDGNPVGQIPTDAAQVDVEFRRNAVRIAWDSGSLEFKK